MERREFRMWKKMLPLVVLSGILLVGCNNNGAVPNNNETPMEDIGDDARQWNNDVERNVEDRNNDNGNTNNNGETNGTNNGMNTDGNNTNGENTNGIDNNPEVDIIEDLNRENDVE